MREHDWILVGVDGAEGGRAAIRYAVDEARRHNARLRLVHVAPDYVPSSSAYQTGDETASLTSDRIGRGILAEAEQEAHGLIDPARVTTLLLTGYRVPTLVRAAADAGLVVLGDEPRPILERVATGSVLGGVAAHSPVPVVAVPAGWAPLGTGRPRVVVAVKDYTRAKGLVRRALEAAEERKAELVLLHARESATGYGAGRGADAPEEWEREARDALEQTLQALPKPSADVAVRIDIRRGQPARVLVDASQQADLLLIARRAHGFPFGHLGGTGRAVLRASQGPVEVTPPATEAIGPDDRALKEDDTFTQASGASSMESPTDLRR